MMAFLLKFKAKAYLIGTFIVAVLAAWARIKYLEDKADRLQKRADTYKAQAEQEIAINEAESEIEQEFSHRASQAKKDIKRGEMPDNIRNRNS